MSAALWKCLTTESGMLPFFTRLHAGDAVEKTGNGARDACHSVHWEGDKDGGNLKSSLLFPYFYLGETPFQLGSDSWHHMQVSYGLGKGEHCKSIGASRSSSWEGTRAA